MFGVVAPCPYCGRSCECVSSNGWHLDASYALPATSYQAPRREPRASTVYLSRKERAAWMKQERQRRAVEAAMLAARCKTDEPVRHMPEPRRNRVVSLAQAWRAA
jgi:hypothetical protein